MNTAIGRLRDLKTFIAYYITQFFSADFYNREKHKIKSFKKWFLNPYQTAKNSKKSDIFWPEKQLSNQIVVILVIVISVQEN